MVNIQFFKKYADFFENIHFFELLNFAKIRVVVRGSRFSVIWVFKAGSNPLALGQPNSPLNYIYFTFMFGAAGLRTIQFLFLLGNAFLTDFCQFLKDMLGHRTIQFL